MRNSLTITIVGTGYVGLTTGLAFAFLGHRVNCIDQNREVVRKLQSGEPTIYEQGLKELMLESAGNITFSDALDESLHVSDIVIIAVGTPSKENGDTDLSYVESASREIGRLMSEEKTPVIVNKSTVPLGTSRRVETVIKDELEKRGHKACFSVASNPEFLREGAALHDALYPDRIVVGVDDVKTANILRQLYTPILEQTFIPPRVLPRPENYRLPALVTTNPTSAELIKYASNAFLAMKISFINEFACVAEKVGADIREVAKGIGLDQRIGPGFLQAGAGWGGSCFPKDTRSILFTAGQYGLEMPLVDAAIKVNRRQRKKIVEKLQETLKVVRGSTIAILGLAFKADTDDIRESPAIDVIGELLEMGARVKVYDPVAMEKYRTAHPEHDVVYVKSVEDAARDSEALVLLTGWEDFRQQSWPHIAGLMRKAVFIDGRNYLDAEAMRSWGYNYLGMGC